MEEPTVYEIGIEQFFQTARERYHIMLRRNQGKPFPWTEDSIFQDWFFCNVRREDDKTTYWFKKNIRDHVEGLKAIEACIIFRWFNRISTGEIIKDLLVEDRWDHDEVKLLLEDVRPIVTGAYMIKTTTGLNKLDGILETVDETLPQLPQLTSSWGNSLEEAWKDLKVIPYMGPFMAYEVISDLRWTSVLSKAKDIMTWANPGPGCHRGIQRIVFGENWRGQLSRNNPDDKTYMLEVMTELLENSNSSKFWPKEWPAWEMREVEHWLCEFDKYKRVEEGNRMKRRFRYKAARK